MADLTWPTSLPQDFLSDTFSCEPAASAEMHDFQDGPPGTAASDVAPGDNIQGDMRCTLAQIATFRNWRENSIARGKLPFDWIHPVDCVSCEMLLIGYKVAKASGTRWTLTLKLRTLS